MEGINAANFTKIVLCCFCMKLVEGKIVFASYQSELFCGNAMHDCTSSGAQRAIASHNSLKIRCHFKLNFATMTATTILFHLTLQKSLKPAALNLTISALT
jgi:hypothetical protein